MSKALDIAENLALLSTKYTSSTSTLDSVALGSSTTGTFNGTLGSSVTFPAGHIIQTQQQLKTIASSGNPADIVEATIDDQTFNTGYKIHEFSFTPKHSASKLLLQYDGQVQTQGDSAGAELYFSRDNTNSGTDNGTKTRSGSDGNKVANQFVYTHVSNTHLYFPINMCQLVDAGQNTAIRFMVIVTSYDGNNVVIQHDGTSVFTIMEIAQ